MPRELTADPGASDLGLVVRPIPSGTQTISGTVTANQGGAWTVTVTATNLDIRDLTSVTDSVAAAQSGAWTVTANAGTGTFVTNPTSLTTRDIGRVYTPSPVEGATAYFNVRLSDGSGFYVAGSATEPATFYAVFDRIAPAANKYMATLFNTSTTRKAVVRRIWFFNWQVAAVTGILLEQYLAFITARTAGTSVTIRSYDSGDTLSAGIAADTNSTVVTERDIMKRFFTFSEEHPAIGTAAPPVNVLAQHDLQMQLLYEKSAGAKGITLRENQGVSIRNVTSSTVGTCSYCIELTDEAA